MGFIGKLILLVLKVGLLMAAIAGALVAYDQYVRGKYPARYISCGSVEEEDILG